MNGTIQKIEISSFNCEIYLPEQYNVSDEKYPVVYVNGEKDISEIMNKIELHFKHDCQSFILVGIESHNWNSDYTPWPAPALTKKAEAFKGEADNYLYKLIYEVKPFIDENYRTKPEPHSTVIVGYSLAGLAALYTLYKTSSFGKIGSISTSMWYDGFIEFMEANRPVSNKAKVYMSLGKIEEKSRNQRIAKVGDCTRRAFHILKSQLSVKENLTFELNNGGHFMDIPKRFEKALLWLMN
ncbi:alpha/beta hydrolase [Clostridium guangxiense]|uniref:alpha/beta hydrolase n=1 Tax=Clostridium guangxiense TaxID=1662055 RepID=UPI001E516986|nr:alpha/beta hydrolase-fold protein [Clostridium guangxiense]MCD2346113.1 alpha/beta hydrolase [Clostridium guangxiense]